MKRFISLILSALLCIVPLSVNAAETDDTRYAKMDMLISQMMSDDDPTDGSQWNTENTTAFKWSYINGCMVSAMTGLYDTTGDSSYLTFADTYMEPFISESKVSSSAGYIAATSFKYTNYTLDDLNCGKALIDLIGYNSENSTKYKKALTDTLYSPLLTYMLSNQTTAEGNLWHKKAYPYQVWLDGIYMETPFYLQYELEIAESKTAFDTAANHITNQIENVYAKLRNADTGLYYHGYDAQADPKSGSYNKSSAISWASEGSGHSDNYWLRGTGWYAMALVDDIELLQQAEVKFGADYSQQISSLSAIYTELADSMLKYQDKSTHLWYQVIDNPDVENSQYNYLETSGSAAMAYSLMKAYNIGIADISYYKEGRDVFRGLCDNKLNYNSSGSAVTLCDICGVAGLAGPSSGKTSSSATRGPKHTARDGSYDYYVSERLVSDDAKGAAPLIFAYCEIMKYENALGDTNLDGSVTKADAALLLKHISGISALDDNVLHAGDMNEDGALTISDVIAIIKNINQ